ncbi:hypothetical protein LUZ63_011849 [Rhynchospora breviuscula]|uniref:Uncharacterized protein n=1 Tax=Rhynchospora breviuscula TaxID=2022672 RepID=A0A9Q0CJH3_9POAL|nr:hypothetical protein LUZ63_011849 [Rhynchospora breviuscula]
MSSIRRSNTFDSSSHSLLFFSLLLGGCRGGGSQQNKETNDEKTDRWYCVERSSTKFLWRFRHPENVKMESEVLTGTVPMEEVKKPSGKSIEISI